MISTKNINNSSFYNPKCVVNLFKNIICISIALYLWGVYCIKEGSMIMENSCPHCGNKHTPRNKEDIKNLQIRLNRIVGQVHGISKMIEENRYCSDVLTQIAAVEKALEQVGYIILEEHMKSCVVDDIKKDDFSSLEESIELMKKLK